MDRHQEIVIYQTHNIADGVARKEEKGIPQRRYIAVVKEDMMMMKMMML